MDRKASLPPKNRPAPWAARAAAWSCVAVANATDFVSHFWRDATRFENARLCLGSNRLSSCVAMPKITQSRAAAWDGLAAGRCVQRIAGPAGGVARWPNATRGPSSNGFFALNAHPPGQRGPNELHGIHYAGGRQRLGPGSNGGSTWRKPELRPQLLSVSCRCRTSRTRTSRPWPEHACSVVLNDPGGRMIAARPCTFEHQPSRKSEPRRP